MYVTSLSNLLQWAVRQTTELENAMTSVERNLRYTKLDQEPPRCVLSLTSDLSHLWTCRSDEGGGETPERWPTTGGIEYRSVTASYRPGLEPALKNFSFAIPGGSSVGVVGRTGAGKSSLLLTLFRLRLLRAFRLPDEVVVHRLIDITEGEIKIDGVNTANIGLDVLRKQIAVIPQDPVLFGGRRLFVSWIIR